MSRYFVDTAHWLALGNSRDQWHERALAWASTVKGRFWTTDYILLELADGLSNAPLRSDAVTLIDDLRHDASTIIIPQSRELFERGLALDRTRSDKDWSLTDCISFVVMWDEGLSDALTSDHHFEQAGFRALLRMPLPSTSGP